MIFMLEKVETNGPQTSQTTIYNDQLQAATNSSSPAIPPVTKCSKKARAIGNSPPKGNQSIDLPILQNRCKPEEHMTMLNFNGIHFKSMLINEIFKLSDLK